MRRLDAAERLGEEEQLRALDHARSPRPSSRPRTRPCRRSRASAARRRRGRGGRAGPGSSTRVDPRVRGEEGGDARGRRRSGRCMRMASVFSAAQREVAVQRAGHGADRVLQEASRSARASFVTSAPADQVGVAAEVLRRRVHDDVGAELERALQVRASRRCCRRRTSAPAACATSATAAMSMILSSGLVGVSTQTTGVSAGRRRGARRGRSGPRRRTRAPSGSAPWRSAGMCRRRRRSPQHDVVAGVEREQQGRLGGQPDGEREPVRAALERGEHGLERRRASGSRRARSRSPSARRRPSWAYVEVW